MLQRLSRFALAVAAAVLLTVVCQGQSVMTHHVRDVARSGEARPKGSLPSNEVLQLDIVLPLRDEAGLERFLQELYDPASPSYQQYLTPQEFTAKFGPTQEDYDSVVRFAQAYGFKVVGGSRDGMDVQVQGRVSVIETAFHLSMRTYQHPTESRIFFGPDSEPTLDLQFNLWHISGLDNYSIPHPDLVNRDDFARAHGLDPEKRLTRRRTLPLSRCNKYKITSGNVSNTIKADGTDQPVEFGGTVSIAPEGSNAWKMVIKTNGKVVSSMTHTLSLDGSTQSIKGTDTKPDGCGSLGQSLQARCGLPSHF